ncbi:MAG: hypothetical protein IPK73_09040 [Candidatus Obscuribacter sp.]|nr:hypothetical protein [Candidatus Obscuribacter sp.]MBK9279747.1 hypothetical protein [Candidatus Obscuribacter sp.]
MIQCDICQVVNEDAAQFCKECGGRLAKPMTAAIPEQSPVKPRPKLHSPILGGADDPLDEEPEAQTMPKRKNKKGLRSPMLGGGDDDEFEEDEPQSEPQKRSGRGLRSPILGGKAEESDRPKGRGGLRSPILGGGAVDDFDDEPAPTTRKGKGGLRSPMLGGSDDFDDDDEEFGTNPPAAPRKGGLRSPILGGGGGGAAGKSHIEFPHRSHDLPESDDQAPVNHSKPPKGLRSPLLGGDDGDFEEMPAIDRGRGHGTSNSRPGRLRSPILGGSGDEFDDYSDDEDDSDDEPDENALRSPLLAVRAPRHEKPKAPTRPEPERQNIEPETARPAPAPSPMPAPLPAPQAHIQPQAQIQPQPSYEYGVTGSQFSASPGASSTQLPQMPQAPPRYQPQPAPKPTNSNYRMPEQTLIQLEPAREPAPAPVPMQAPTAPAPPAAPAPQKPLEEKNKQPEKLRSRLLSADEPDDFVGPSDRRALGDRRTGPRASRRSSDMQVDADDEDFSYGAKGGGNAPNSMAPMAMALIGVALIAKAWFIFSYFKGDPMTQTSMIADQLTSTVALIGAIMMVSKGARPS